MHLLKHYVLSDKFCVELMLLRQGSKNFYIHVRSNSQGNLLLDFDRIY